VCPQRQLGEELRPPAEPHEYQMHDLHHDQRENGGADRDGQRHDHIR
jgi:hypothetical protein